MIKKTLSVILALILMASSAMAECKCIITESYQKIVYDLLIINGLVIEDAERESIFAIISGKQTKCSEARTAVLNVYARNYSIIIENFSEMQTKLLVEYITKCCCGEAKQTEVTNAPTVRPTSTPKPHTHSFGDWQDASHCEHVRYCKCGEEERGLHNYGSSLGTESGSDGRMVNKYYCDVCRSYGYFYAD